MEMLSALLTLCKGNPPVTSWYPSQRASNEEYCYLFHRFTPEKKQKNINLSMTWNATTPMWYNCDEALKFFSAVKGLTQMKSLAPISGPTSSSKPTLASWCIWENKQTELVAGRFTTQGETRTNDVRTRTYTPTTAMDVKLHRIHR